VHQVWDCELGRFNTLEMMEWQRIMRNKTHLQRQRDIHGQPIFTDEQMLTYLKQFERDFKVAPQRVIDATEGGLPKQHVETMPLAEALSRYAVRDAPKLPIPNPHPDPDRLLVAAEQTERRLEEVRELRQATNDAIRVLNRMKKHQRDQAKMNRLFARMKKIQQRVHGELKLAFALINHINAVGSFRRIRTDRLNQRGQTERFERQLKQIDRDLENLSWIMESCDQAICMLDDSRCRTRRRLDFSEHRHAAEREPVHA